MHQESLPYKPEVIKSDLIRRDYIDPLAGYFGIDKIRKLIAQKDYWSILGVDIKTYIKIYNACLASKTVKHKSYNDLQSRLIPIHQ